MRPQPLRTLLGDTRRLQQPLRTLSAIPDGSSNLCGRSRQYPTAPATFADALGNTRRLQQPLRSYLLNTSTNYFVPVLPNPPAPRCVSDKTSTASSVTCSYFEITICAMRSPCSMVCGSGDRLIIMT
jgi:hypothetical protein